MTASSASLRTNLVIACDGVAVVVDDGKVSDIICLHRCRVFDTVPCDLSLGEMVLTNGLLSE